ncbi:MAG: Ig-like domain-containing protein [Treponema sp.]|uniref:Ig-like domain-containing protein n=1 Tax=Treponema sp. TaxID=166 RepID=UPI002A916F06|nr:Ig-like domain-containing protein [Treponema sp.]MDY6396229.1 Ig-like domain-containing protein [Treponema sp.]
MHKLSKALTFMCALLALTFCAVSCKTDDDDDPTMYTVTVSSSIEHGKVTADKSSAEAWATVKLTPTADSGYELDSYSVKDEKSNTIPVTEDTFIMPKSNVTVSATFKETAETVNKNAVAAVIAKITAIGTVAYSDESKAKIDDARKAYNALTKAQKELVPAETLSVLTAAEASYAANAVITKITAIGTVAYSDESKAKIDDARKAYDTLTEAQKALVPAETLNLLTSAETAYAELKAAADSETANKTAADAVIAKITAIGTVAYTSESKAKIDDARKAYNALTEAQKALVPAETLNLLTSAESKYTELKAAADSGTANQNAADAVIAKITAIGTVAYTTESKSKIDEARTAYDALTGAQKALIPAETLAVLTKAETDYNALKTSADEAAANQAAADAVIAKINAIGTVAYTSDSKTKIDAARTAYDALTSDQKALVTNYSTLTTAESSYESLAPVRVTAITLNKTATEIKVGSTETLSVTAVAPDNATDKTYTWKTSDASKATVTAEGVVTAVAEGTVTIYAEANDGSGVKGNCTVTVQAGSTAVLSGALVDGATIKVNFKWRNMNDGDYVQGVYSAASGTFTASKGGSYWGRDDRRAVYKVEKSGNNIIIGAGLGQYNSEGMVWTFNTTNDTYTTTNGNMVNRHPEYYGLISVTLNGTDITSQLTNQ